ncbi:MAG: TonB-dependent receptor, partial [Gammaproteobacteria bacterium]|nr:TonB-dependent receptor [Gammaproteobacteria bacterium]
MRDRWQRIEFLVATANLRTYFDDLTAQSHISIDPDSDQYTLFSMFFQDDYPLHDRLTLTLGSKFEHNDFTGWEIQPNGRLLWKVTETASLLGAVSRAVRTPARLESDGRIGLALYPPMHPLNPTPNPMIPVPIPVIVTF